MWAEHAARYPAKDTGEEIGNRTLAGILGHEQPSSVPLHHEVVVREGRFKVRTVEDLGPVHAVPFSPPRDTPARGLTGEMGTRWQKGLKDNDLRKRSDLRN